jgi:dihydrodipicolinate synthase/N-acetylneuraminate lyase
MPIQAKLTRQNLHGVWHALLVPWTDDDRLDEKRFAKEIRSYAGAGLHGMYTGGTTGEYYAQDDDAFERITKICCDEAHAIGLPVQIGCTTLSTRTARRRVTVALDAGADAIQIAYPFWLELKPDEVLSFMRDVAAEAGEVPIVLYHTSRSKRKLSPQEVGVMAREIPTFIGMKDTGCDVTGLKAMLKEAPDLSIFGGEDFYEKCPAGGRGGYCSVTGINAKYIVTYSKLAAAGKLAEAKPYHDTVNRLLKEALIPMVTADGLWDSAIDRIQRVVGGGDVGLRCQPPYRSGTPQLVENVRAWCQRNAPQLLQQG